MDTQRELLTGSFRRKDTGTALETLRQSVRAQQQLDE